MMMKTRTAGTILTLGLALSFAAGVLAAPARTADGGPASQKSRKTSQDKDARYQCDCGIIAIRYGLPDEAIRYGKLAVSLDPGLLDGWNLLGSAYARKGELALAAEAYEKAATIKPGSPDIQRELGLIYLGLDDTVKAEAALKRAFDAGGDAEAAYALGKLRYGQKRFDEAMDYALKAIQKDGKSAKAYNLKGVLLNQKGRFAEAAGSFQAGLVLLPEDVGLRINLGIALFNSGEYAKARAVFEAVLPKIEEAELKKQVQNYIQAIKDAGK